MDIQHLNKNKDEVLLTSREQLPRTAGVRDLYDEYGPTMVVAFVDKEHAAGCSGEVTDTSADRLESRARTITILRTDVFPPVASENNVL